MNVHSSIIHNIQKWNKLGTSLVVQWLRLGAFTAGAWGQSLVRELRSSKPPGQGWGVGAGGWGRLIQTHQGLKCARRRLNSSCSRTLGPGGVEQTMTRRRFQGKKGVGLRTLASPTWEDRGISRKKVSSCDCSGKKQPQQTASGLPRGRGAPGKWLSWDFPQEHEK